MADRPDFQATHLPEDLQGIRLNEAKIIWREIFRPCRNLYQIEARQAVILKLSKVGDFANLRRSKNLAYQALEGYAELFCPLRISGQEREVSLLEAFRQELARSSVERNSQIVSRAQSAFQSIQAGRAALNECSRLLRTSDSPYLCLIAGDLEGVETALGRFTPDYFSETWISITDVKKSLRDYHETLQTFGVFVEVAKLVKKGYWNAVSADPSRPAYYREGYNIVYPESLGFRNDSPADTPVTVYSGSEKSGKTTTGLLQHFLIQLSWQAFGITAAKQGNLHIHGAIALIGKSATINHESGRSVHETERKNMAEMFNLPGESPLYFLNEPASHLSAAEQASTIESVVQTALTVPGGRVIIDTHNQDFIENAVRDPVMAVYHFETQVAPDGKVIYCYAMLPGRG